MLNPAQKQRLADLEAESLRVSFERTKYTFDHSPKGIAEWDRLWARRIEIDKEIDRLKGVRDVQVPNVPVETNPAE